MYNLVELLNCYFQHLCVYFESSIEKSVVEKISCTSLCKRGARKHSRAPQTIIITWIVGRSFFSSWIITNYYSWIQRGNCCLFWRPEGNENKLLLFQYVCFFFIFFRFIIILARIVAQFKTKYTFLSTKKNKLFIAVVLFILVNVNGSIQIYQELNGLSIIWNWCLLFHGISLFICFN